MALIKIAVIIFMLLHRTWSKSCVEMQIEDSEIPGNMTLVALIPTERESGELLYPGVEMVEAFKFSMWEANKFLQKQQKNFHLGYRVYHQCSKVELTTKAVLDVVVGHGIHTDIHHDNVSCDCRSTVHNNILGFIGPLRSRSTVGISPITAAEDIPIISCSATSPIFSNRTDHPMFLRTIPSDNDMAIAFADLIRYFNWTYVSLVVSDTEYGTGGRNVLFTTLQKHGVCLEVDEKIAMPATIKQLDEVIVKLIASKASIVVIWTEIEYTRQLIQRASYYKMYNKTLVVQPSTSEAMLTVDPKVTSGAIKAIYYGGTCEACIENFFQTRVSPTSKEWYKQMIYSTHKHQALNSSSFPLSLIREEFNGFLQAFLHQAVFSYVNALNSYLQNENVNTTHKHLIKHWNRIRFYKNYLKNVNFFESDNSHVQYNSHGDPLYPRFKYSIAGLNGKDNISFHDIGYWSRLHGVQITENVPWKTGKRPVSICSDECAPGHYMIDTHISCCWKCVPCGQDTYKNATGREPCRQCPPGTTSNPSRTSCLKLKIHYISPESIHGIVILMQAALGIISTILVIVVFITYRYTPMVRSSNKLMSAVQLVAQFTLFMSLPLYNLEPKIAICVSRITILGTSFTISQAVTLVKTELLLRLFKLHARISRREKTVTTSIITLVIAALVTLHICLMAASFVWIPQTKDLKQVTVGADRTIECNSDRLLLFQFGFFILLSLLSGIQAFRARTLPLNFNEAQRIAYALMASTITLCIWIPLFFSVTKYSSQNVVTTTALFLTTMINQLALYGYKVYIIIWKPERNNLRVSRVQAFQDMQNCTNKQLRQELALRKALSVESTDSNSTPMTARSGLETPTTARSDLDVPVTVISEVNTPVIPRSDIELDELPCMDRF